MCLRRTLGLALLAIMPLAGVAACDSAYATNRTEILSDLADRLAIGDRLTYTATYQLPGGATATLTQAQRPARVAVEYPGGKIVISGDQATTCQGSRCTTAAVSGTAVETGLATRAGLVLPSTVADLLSAASLDAAGQFDRRDTTIVGLHATCVRTAGSDLAPALDACVTSDGVLGSFTGQVDGHSIDLTLTGYRSTADTKAFLTK